MTDFEQSEAFQAIAAYRLPRYEELPDFRLYIDQLIELMVRTLAPLMAGEEGWITAAMVGNYAKQSVLPRPEGKRYTREHAAYLIFVCLAKQVVSIADLQTLRAIQARDYPLDVAYDYLCTEFENVLRHVFKGEALRPDSSRTHTRETRVVRSICFAVTHRIYLQQYLRYMRAQEQSEA